MRDAVFRQSRWTEDFTQTPGRLTAQVVELPEPVLRLDVSVREEQIGGTGCPDVGHASFRPAKSAPVARLPH